MKKIALVDNPSSDLLDDRGDVEIVRICMIVSHRD